MAKEKKDKTEETMPVEADAAAGEPVEAKADVEPSDDTGKASKKKKGKEAAGDAGPKKSDKKSDKKKDKKEDAPPEPYVPLVPPRMLLLYRDKVVPQMMKEFGWTNANRVPRIEHVTINIGIGEGARDIKQIEASIVDVRTIAGQQPVITRARKSAAQYKLRAGMPLGLMLTLRGRRMYHFLDKLFNLALPRVRDFQGLNPNSFDGRGNFTMGLKEQLVFPEIDYDKVSRVRGMDITIVTSARNDVEAAHLLKGLGCPLRS